jgi:PleD family two-component response regulator
MDRSDPKRILIIDGDRPELATLAQILLLNKYKVLRAEEETKALQIVKKARPDLIICNAHSEKLDAIGLLRKMRSNTRTRSIPFLFITGSKDMLEKRMSDLHLMRFLVMPFTRAQLAVAVQESLKLSHPATVRNSPDRKQ